MAGDDYLQAWARKLSKQTGEQWSPQDVANAEKMMRRPFTAVTEARDR